MEELLGFNDDELVLADEFDVNPDDVEDDDPIDNDDEPAEEEPVEELEDEGKKLPPSEKDNNKNLNSSSSNVYSSFTNALTERGFFSEEIKDKIEDFDSLEEVLNRELESRIEGRIKDLTPDEQFWISKRKVGYSDDEIYSQLSTQKGFENIDEDAIRDESERGIKLRRDLLTALYSNKGFDGDKLTKKIDRIFDGGYDVDEALEAKTELETAFKANQAKQDELRVKQTKEAEKSRKEALENLKIFVSTTKEIIPGNKLTQKEKDELYKGLTTPVKTLEDGTALDIVGNYLNDFTVEDRAKLAYVLKITDGLKNLDGLSTKKAKSKVVQQFENAAAVVDIKEFQNSGVGDNLNFLQEAEFIFD